MIVALVIASISLFAVFSIFHAQQTSSRELADELGLHAEPNLITMRLYGRLRGFQVEVFSHRLGIGIDVLDVDPGFSLGRDSVAAWMAKPDIHTGDPDFDDRIRIEGDADLALAILDDETRNAVDLVVSAGGTVENGRIRTIVQRTDKIRSAVETSLDLAQRLSRPTDDELPQLLARCVLGDSPISVRLQAFRRLSSSFRASEVLGQTARSLRNSRDAHLQLEACRTLLRVGGTEGAEAARGLIQLARRRDLDASTRRRALESVARSAFRGLGVSAMAELLGDLAEPSELRRTAIGCLARAKALRELLTVPLGDDEQEARKLAEALGQLGDPSAQTRLFQLLRHSESGVRAEAARALGAVGDARAVEELRRIEASGVLGKLTLGRAAEAAIEKIQARLGGSQAGEISLVAVQPLEGAVSRADTSDDVEGGEVSEA